MKRLSSRIAPIHMLWSARCIAVPFSLLFVTVYVIGSISSAAIWAWVFAETLIVLIAFPRIRSSDLCGILAILVSCADFLSASLFHQHQPGRWLIGLASIGAVIVSMKIYRLRARLTDNPYRPFKLRERRGKIVRDSLVEPAPSHDVRQAIPSRYLVGKRAHPETPQCAIATSAPDNLAS
jgi:hypothetical protein